jgi:hypothetical protein
MEENCGGHARSLEHRGKCLTQAMKRAQNAAGAQAPRLDHLFQKRYMVDVQWLFLVLP